MPRIVEQRPEPIEEKVEPELLKKVKAALIKAGYELPDLKSKQARAQFVETHRYDPQIVINSTYQMARVFRDWKKRIALAPVEDEEEE